MEVSGEIHTPGRFTLQERTRGIHCEAGWVGPSDGMEEVVMRKNPNQ